MDPELAYLEFVDLYVKAGHQVSIDSHDEGIHKQGVSQLRISISLDKTDVFF